MVKRKASSARSPVTASRRDPRTKSDSPPKKADGGLIAGSGKPARRRRSENAAGRGLSKNRRDDRGQTFPIVGVGASAGGLEAFTQLLKHVPADCGLAFVLVQHLDPKHPSMLSGLLSRTARLPVHEVVDGERVEPDRVFVIPPNTNMILVDGVLRLMPRDVTRGRHLPIDSFLSSLAEAVKDRAVGVILSGTASDGAMGLKAIKAAGGITFAQDSASARYDGMPRSAVAAGGVDFVLPPEKIAMALAKIGHRPYEERAGAPKDPGSPTAEENLDAIFSLLRTTTGTDFADYRRTTILRRIRRRIVLHKLDGVAEYVKFLQGNPAELQALHEDLLIHVTSFFRNPELDEALKTEILPALMKNRSPEAPLRIWVPGCSTGEEAYSVAIGVLEFLGEARNNPPVQVFASDVNEAVIGKARQGRYPARIEKDVSPERLRRFFFKANGTYQVNRIVREMCVFAEQDLTRDPPFSHLDLISCCNVLIYLEPALQKRILSIFHYALKPGGLLVLGRSETPGALSSLFELVDRKHKIFSRKEISTRIPLDLATGAQALEWIEAGKRRLQTVACGSDVLDMQQEADRIVLARYAPAGVLIDQDMEILQFRGSTGPYLEAAPGAASFNLFKMVREGLLPELRSAIHTARKGSVPVRKESRVGGEGQTRRVAIEVIPFKAVPSRKDGFLVLFEDVARPTGPESQDTGGPRPHGRVKKRGEDRQLDELRQELTAAKEQLRSVIEEQDATNEELQSANEEILSSNEELQSTNEELETAKEELESANEELSTLNEELQNRNLELNRANNDLTNLLGSVNIPIVMMGSGLRVRRFTQMAERTLRLSPTDVGRPVGDLRLGIDVPDLEPLLAAVIDTASPNEREVQDREGRWYVLRLLPYRSSEDEIEGAVMVLVDVDALKRSQERVEQARDYAEAIVQTVRAPLVVLGANLRVQTANRSFYEAFGVSPPETEGSFIYDLGNRQWNIPRLRTLLEELLPQKAQLHDFEVDHEFEGIGLRSMLLNARTLHQGDGRPELILLAIEDITERKGAEEALMAANRAKDVFLAMLSHELRSPLNAIVGWTSLLRTGRLDEKTFAHAVETIERNARMQTKIIDDLLDVSRIISGKLQFDVHSLELVPLVEAAIDAVRPAAEAKGIRLQTALDPEAGPIPGDAFRLQQVVGNLLSNAIKFTPTDGLIEVRLERVGSHAELSVRDTGQGIRKDFLAHVFDRFRQADSRSTRLHGGLGLGLTIVRQLVEMHGGTVRAESEGEGQGATFRVTLPREDSVVASLLLPPVGSQPPGSAKALAGVRVLVADDDADARMMMQLVLAQHGAEVRVCASAAEALDAVGRWGPEVLVSDIGMPEEDGYELMRRVRALEPSAGGGIPALALTGYVGTEDRQRALAAGYQMHMSKPVEPVELAAAIARLAGRISEKP